jgi:hypothetical protein
VTKKPISPEEAFAHLSDDAARLSGEMLAANVLAAAVTGCLGAGAVVAERARALLARVKLESGNANENARLMAVAEARLEALLSELQGRHLKH